MLNALGYSDLDAFIADVVPADMSAPTASAPTPDARAEAEQALVALGYKPTEASKLVSAVDDASGSTTSEELIRQALQLAMR